MHFLNFDTEIVEKILNKLDPTGVELFEFNYFIKQWIYFGTEISFCKDHFILSRWTNSIYGSNDDLLASKLYPFENFPPNQFSSIGCCTKELLWNVHLHRNGALFVKPIA